MFKYQSIPHLIELSGKYEVGSDLLPTGVCTGGLQCEPCIQINEGEIGHTEPHVHFEEYQARPLNDGDWIILPSGDADSRYFDTISSEQLMTDYRPVNEGNIEEGQEESMWRLLARELNWDRVATRASEWLVAARARADSLDAREHINQIARNFAVIEQCRTLLQQHGFAGHYSPQLVTYVFQYYAGNVKGVPQPTQSTPAGATPQWRQRLQKENPQ